MNPSKLAPEVVDALGGGLFDGVRRFWERVEHGLRPRTVKEIEGRIRALLDHRGVCLKPSQFQMLVATVRAMLPRLDDEAVDVRHEKMLGVAMQYAEKQCSPQHQRGWLLAGAADSYQNKSQRAEFWVLEGSPPVACITHVHGRHGWVSVNGRGGEQLKLIVLCEVFGPRWQ